MSDQIRMCTHPECQAFAKSSGEVVCQQGLDEPPIVTSDEIELAATVDQPRSQRAPEPVHVRRLVARAQRLPELEQVLLDALQPTLELLAQIEDHLSKSYAEQLQELAHARADLDARQASLDALTQALTAREQAVYELERVIAEREAALAAAPQIITGQLEAGAVTLDQPPQTQVDAAPADAEPPIPPAES